MKIEQIIRSVMEQGGPGHQREGAQLSVDDLAESYVVLCVRLWLETDEFWNAWAGYYGTTKLALDLAGIRFAGQKIDIVMKEHNYKKRILFTGFFFNRISVVDLPFKVFHWNIPFSRII